VARDSYKASAPGKLMLMGEHAVLHGKLALVCAVSQRILVTLIPRSDSQITISSSLGNYSTDLRNYEIQPPFQFVLTAITQQLALIDSGLDLVIESSFTDEMGLGSSAAVTAATTAVVMHWKTGKIIQQSVFDEGLLTIRKIQGTGSGADLAASVFGGVLAYRMEPVQIEKLDCTFPISVVYSGSKQPTVNVIKKVESLRAAQPTVFDSVYDLMEKCTNQAVVAIKKKDWITLGQLLNINQGLMDAIGVNNKILSEINYALREDVGIFGSKISGSGLGDCVVGLGKVQNANLPYAILPLEISVEGVRIE
jgi:mevalonate kinase